MIITSGRGPSQGPRPVPHRCTTGDLTLAPNFGDPSECEDRLSERLSRSDSRDTFPRITEPGRQNGTTGRAKIFVRSPSEGEDWYLPYANNGSFDP